MRRPALTALQAHLTCTCLVPHQPGARSLGWLLALALVVGALLGLGMVLP